MEAPQPTSDLGDMPTWLEPLLYVTMAIVAVWLVATLFIYMRRRAVNLTSASGAKVQKDVAPDFLTVDHKAREAAMKRGEAYDDKLTEREKAAAAGQPQASKPKSNLSLLQALSGMASLLFSIFSLVGALFGVITQVDRMGLQISKADKLMLLIQKYPIPTVICVLVIGYHIYLWISRRKWAEAPKI